MLIIKNYRKVQCLPVGTDKPAWVPRTTAPTGLIIHDVMGSTLGKDWA